MIIAFIGNNGTGKTTIAKERGKGISIMTLKSILIKMWNSAKKDCEEKVFNLQEKGESKKIICLGCHKGDIALSAARKIISVIILSHPIGVLNQTPSRVANTFLERTNSIYQLRIRLKTHIVYLL